MTFDPIKPYIKLITTLLFVGLLCGAYVTGCNHGEDNKEQEVVEVTAQRDALAEANRAWVAVAKEANKQAKANKQAAQEQYDRANALSEELSKSRHKTAQVNDKLNEALDRAKEIPSCATLLEQHYCSAAPVYSLD